MNDNGWNEWKNHVLLELEGHNKRLDNIDQSLNRLWTEISALKVKSGLWGFLGAMVPISILLIYQMVNGG